MAKPDHNASIAFLKLLSPSGPWTLTAIHPAKRNESTGDAETRTRTYSDIEMAQAFLDQHREYNLYYNVNPTVEAVSKKPERHEIAHVRFLHVDVDAIPGESLTMAWERVKAKLAFPPGGLLPPTALIQSGGGGGNALWALEEPVPIEGLTPVERDASADYVKGYSYQIELLVGGADACHNVDRILRLPGTLNWPTEKKRLKYGRNEPTLAVLEFWEKDRVYPISKFVRAQPVQARKGDRGGPTRHDFSASANIERIEDIGQLDLSRLVDANEVRATITDGTPPQRFITKWGGDRSKMVLWVCCELVRAGVEDNKIYSIITDPAFPVSAHVLDQGSGMKRYAERQIDRAHDMAIHEDLVWLNERYAAVEDAGGKCVVIKETDDGNLSYLSPGSFKEFFQNRFVKVVTTDKKGNLVEQEVEMGTWWWRHPARRQFNDITFAPNRKTPGRYNLWRGFTVIPTPGDWSVFRELMLNNLCRGNKEYLNYLLGWMAHAVQYPDQPGHTAVVLQGEQGTGKGTFASVFGSLWGPHYYHLIKGDQLTGRFTGHLRNKLFVFADEAFFAGDHRNVSEIKGLVTEPTMNIEDKGLRIITVPNYLKILIASNKQWVVSAEKSDRRFFVLVTAAIASAEVRKQRIAIDRQMDAGGRAGLLYDLMAMDLSKFDVRNIPQTEGLSSQKELSLPPEQTWWLGKLYSGELMPNHAGWDKPVNAYDLRQDYYDFFAKRRISGRPLPESSIGRFIIECAPEHPGIHRITRDAQQKIKYMFPPLQVCRTYWAKYTNATFAWPEVNERPDAADPQGAFEPEF